MPDIKPLTQADEPVGIEHFQKKAKEALVKLLKDKKTMLTPAIVANFLSTSYRSIYRWMNSEEWLPSLKMAGEILRFTGDVELTRNTWKGIVERWPESGFSTAPKGILDIAIEKRLLVVLQADDLSSDEKVEELTLRSLRIHVEKHREREKLAEALSKAPDWKTPPTEEEK